MNNLSRLFESSTALLSVLGVFVAAVLLVNPTGEFPLNDDWAYAQNCFALACENRWFFSDWPAMTLVAHTFWGALFCKVFGCSFTVLRLSVLLFSILGLLGFQRLLQWMKLDQKSIIFYTFLLIFNPLWFSLAHTYMTDVPFLSVTIWAFYFFLRASETAKIQYILAATLCSVWACLIRQLGLILPLAFAAVMVWYHVVAPFFLKGDKVQNKQHQSITRILPYAALPVLICYVSIQWFEHWLNQNDLLPQSYSNVKSLWVGRQFDVDFYKGILMRGGIMPLTLGLFLLPVFGGRPIRFSFLGSHFWKLVLLLMGIFLACGFLYYPTGNMFYNIGLGPVVLKGVVAHQPDSWELSPLGLTIFRLISALGAILLIFSTKALSDEHQHLRFMFRVSRIVLACFVVFNCVNWIMIDRYMLVLFPFVMVMLAAKYPANHGWPGWVLLGIMALFSICGTHDYFSWNRARYQGLNDLMAQGVKPSEIDGGFEYNGYHNAGLQRNLSSQKSWWFVRDDEWIVSLVQPYGYDVSRAIPFQRWLPPFSDSMFVFKRKPLVVYDSLRVDMEKITPDSSSYLPIAGKIQAGNGNTQSANRSHTGIYSAQLDKNHPYSLTIPINSFERYERFVVKVWRYPAKGNSASFVIAGSDSQKLWISEGDHITRQDSSGWGLLEVDLSIPESAIGIDGRVYLWNPSDRDTVWFDDFVLYRYRENSGIQQ